MVETFTPDMRAAATAGIVAKRDDLLARHVELMKARAEILSEIRKIDRELADLRAAARAFDLEVEFPPDERELFEKQMENRRREREIELRRTVEQLEMNVRAHGPLETKSDAKIPVREMRGHRDLPASKVLLTGQTERPTIRQFTLDQLQSAGMEGTKAATIRQLYEKMYGHVLHEKTVGMSLYRLLKEGLAARRGHIWFAATNATENKNPDAATAGH